jgi:adenine-specific DNA-methyltransferase
MNKIDESDPQSKSLDIIKDNIRKFKNIFPEVFTEDKIDFESLENLLGEYIDKDDERYNFSWKGKTQARRIAQTTSAATLRPVKEESKNWDKTENLYIEGDNLEVLKLLQKSYFKKIDFIYIDPPYNTGTDLLYKNDFSSDINNYLKFTKQIGRDGLKLKTNLETNGRYHSDWLSMIYSRLIIAKNLLKNEGIICVTIDDYEASKLWLVLDEIFGEENHLGTVIVRNNPKGRMTNKKFSLVHEYALFYGKTSNSFIKKLPVLPGEKSHNYIQDKDSSYYLGINLRKQGVDSSAYNKKGNISNRYYPIYYDPKNGMISSLKTFPIKIYPIDKNGEKRIWRRGIESIDEMYSKGDIWIKYVNNKPQVYFKFRGGLDGKLAQTIWYKSIFSASDYGTKILDSLLGKRDLFSYPKSIYAIMESIRSASKLNNTLILDFFSGSSTTAHAVMKLNSEDGGKRKFIMVQLPEPTDEKSEAHKAGYKNICEIGKERIRRAGDKIVSELKEKDKGQESFLDSDKKSINPDDLDIGFKVFKLDSSNMKTWDPDYNHLEESLLDSIDNFKPDRSEEDILYEILLKYGLDLTLPIEEVKIENKTIYSIGSGSLIVFLGDDINIDLSEKIIEIIRKLNPEITNVIFKDNGFKNDVMKTNVLHYLIKNGVNSVKSI